ncbi:MAG: four helix bundle protein [Nitrospirae bacterium]|nr:four helix bundle protein [Nitrospirota bacterium]
MKIEKFEDINAWQKARILTKQVYRLTRKAKFSKDFGLKDQIQRAAVSIMSNIAEGFDSNRNKEFTKFLEYAKRSASEVQSELYVALDQNYINQKEFTSCYEQAEEGKRLIVGFIKYLSK